MKERKIYSELTEKRIQFKIKKKGMINPNFINKTKTPDEKRILGYEKDRPSTRLEFYKNIKLLPTSPGMIQIKSSSNQLVKRIFCDYSIKTELSDLRLKDEEEYTLGFFNWLFKTIESNDEFNTLIIEFYTFKVVYI